jgi:hypothetical protein
MMDQATAKLHVNQLQLIQDADGSPMRFTSCKRTLPRRIAATSKVVKRIAKIGSVVS